MASFTREARYFIPIAWRNWREIVGPLWRGEPQSLRRYAPPEWRAIRHPWGYSRYCRAVWIAALLPYFVWCAIKDSYWFSRNLMKGNTNA